MNKTEILIILATYEDDTFIIKQLDSIFNQSYNNFKVVVTDDSYTKKIFNIYKKYKKKFSNKIFYETGPKSGFAKNFLSIVISDKYIADLYLFCDQDDIWLENKLEKIIISSLPYVKSKKPFLYGGSTIYIDVKDQIIGKSKNFNIKPSFQNSLFQSFAGGNTMVFNNSQKRLFTNFDLKKNKIISHDWLFYIMCSAHDGVIHYDPIPLVMYRQHKNALIGGNRNFKSLLKRAWWLLSGKYFEWNESNREILDQYIQTISKEKFELLNIYDEIRRPDFPIFYSLKLVYKYKFFRSNVISNLGLIIGIVLSKI